MIETDLVYLRPINIDDVEDMYEYCSNPKVTEMTTIPTYTSIDDGYFAMNNFFLNRDNKIQLDSFAIVYKENEKMIGTIDCSPFRGNGRIVEVGYVLNDKYWNKGIMTELLKLYCGYLFTNTNVERIEISHFINNNGSRRVIEKNNFTFEGIKRAYIVKDNIEYDLKTYSLLKKEFNH